MSHELYLILDMSRQFPYSSYRNFQLITVMQAESLKASSEYSQSYDMCIQ